MSRDGRGKMTGDQRFQGRVPGTRTMRIRLPDWLVARAVWAAEQVWGSDRLARASLAEATAKGLRALIEATEESWPEISAEESARLIASRVYIHPRGKLETTGVGKLEDRAEILDRERLMEQAEEAAAPPGALLYEDELRNADAQERYFELIARCEGLRPGYALADGKLSEAEFEELSHLMVLAAEYEQGLFSRPSVR